MPLRENTDVQPYGNRTVNNKYLYPPRGQIHNPMGIGGNPVLNTNPRTLQRGWLFPIDLSAADLAALSDTADTDTDATDASSTLARAIEEAKEKGVDIFDSEEATATQTSSNLLRLRHRRLSKRFRFSQGKQFQFNPAAININIDFDTAVAPEESEVAGGNGTAAAIGFASTGINMIFDRTQETYAATVGKAGVDPIFRDLGVQKDFFDVFRIIMSGDGTYWDELARSDGYIEQIGWGTPRAGSTTDVLEKIFDIGAAGFTAYNKPVAVYFNANLTIMGLVTGISYVYNKFNANLVPIQGSIELAISIMKSSSANGVNSFMTGGNPDGGTIPSSYVPTTGVPSSGNRPYRPNNPPDRNSPRPV